MWAQLLGALASLGGGIAGEVMSAGDRQKQRELIEGILGSYRNTGLPQLDRVSPELLGPSAAGQVSTDPRLRGEQENVLGRLQEMEKSGGLLLEDQAALNRITNQTARNATAGHGQILNSMKARGVGGSGAEFALAQGNQQAQADRAANQSMDIAGQAQKRYLDSIMNRGQFAGQMRNQDYSEKSAAARARDEFSRYNATARERANMYNANLPQQMFQNSMAKTGAMGNAANGVANYYGGQAQDTRTLWNGLGQAGAAAAGAFDNDYNAGGFGIDDDSERSRILRAKARGE